MHASVGEKMVMYVLEECGIVDEKNKHKQSHIGTYTFDTYFDFKVKKRLRPDFKITVKIGNTIIVLFVEFDGEQHFQPVDFGGNNDWKTAVDDFMEVIENDNIKNNYWKQHNIPYLRIPYNHRKQDLVTYSVKKFLKNNNCHTATQELKGSSTESITHYFTTSTQQQQLQKLQFEKKIKDAFCFKDIILPPNPPITQPDPNNGNWPQRSPRKSWDNMFDELKEFKEVHGHCNVPCRFEDNPPLGGWVSRQRIKYKKDPNPKTQSDESREQFDKLEAIGFNFNLRTQISWDSWNNKFDELKKFKEVHGHCDVPRGFKDNPALGGWVHHQRTKYKNNQSGTQSDESRERFEKLKAIGFNFNLRTQITWDSWNNKFDELKKFKEVHGHCDVPSGFKDNPALGRWVSRQRTKYKNNQSGTQSDDTREQLEKLEGIGFNFSLPIGFKFQTEEKQNNSEKTKRFDIHTGMTPKKLPNGYTDYGNLNGVDTIHDPFSSVFITYCKSGEPLFPIKLHRILCRKENEDIIHWLPHGRSWIVLNKKAFVKKVIPNFFNHGNWKSFITQVTTWGFKRISSGPDEGSYCHELFLKGLPHLSLKMERKNNPKSSFSAFCHSPSPPNFYNDTMYCSLPEYDGSFEKDVYQMSERSGKGHSSFMTRPTCPESYIANVDSSSSPNVANFENQRFPGLHRSIMFPQDVPELSHNESMTSMHMRQNHLRNVLGLSENTFQLPMQSHSNPASLYGLPHNIQNEYTMNPLLCGIQRSLAITDHINNHAAILAQRQRDATMLAELHNAIL